MEQCANVWALNNYEREIEKFEKVVDRFSVEVLDALDDLKKWAEDYEGYDLTTVLKDIIREEYNIEG